MFNNVLQFLLDIFVQGYAAVLLLRFMLQWLRAPMRNPVGDALMSLSNFIVLPVRRYIPSIRQLDSATLLLALFFEVIYLGLMLKLHDYPYASFPLLALFAWACVKLLIMCIYFLMGALIAQAILSWVNPYTPIAPLLQTMTQRFLQPLRRVIPLFGNIDLAPLILLVICQLILLAPMTLLEGWALHLL